MSAERHTGLSFLFYIFSEKIQQNLFDVIQREFIRNFINEFG